jgi:hypothetical protein
MNRIDSKSEIIKDAQDFLEQEVETRQMYGILLNFAWRIGQVDPELTDLIQRVEIAAEVIQGGGDPGQFKKHLEDICTSLAPKRVTFDAKRPPALTGIPQIPCATEAVPVKGGDTDRKEKEEDLLVGFASLNVADKIGLIKRAAKENHPDLCIMATLVKPGELSAEDKADLTEYCKILQGEAKGILKQMLGQTKSDWVEVPVSTGKMEAFIGKTQEEQLVEAAKEERFDQFVQALMDLPESADFFSLKRRLQGIYKEMLEAREAELLKTGFFPALVQSLGGKETLSEKEKYDAIKFLIDKNVGLDEIKLLFQDERFKQVENLGPLILYAHTKHQPAIAQFLIQKEMDSFPSIS